MPHSMWTLLGTAPLNAEPITDLKTLPPGVEQTVRAKVKLPEALESSAKVHAVPQEIKLTFTIDKREDTALLRTVPVWTMLPPGELESFKVQLQDDSRVLRDVKVSGPSEIVAKIKDGTIPVIAYVRLSRDELVKAVGTDATATVHFDLPPGLTTDPAAASVRFTVTKPAEPATTAPPTTK